MKTLKEKAVFNSAASNLWEILSDVTRCDWIDTIDRIEMEGDCRVFEMAGMGKIKERIIKLDNLPKSQLARLLSIEVFEWVAWLWKVVFLGHLIDWKQGSMSLITRRR